MVCVPFDRCEIVGELVALLRAVDEREWLAAEEREAGNVHRHITATRARGEVVEQAPTGVLETKLIDLVVPMVQCVLPGDVPVVIILR